MQDHVQEGAVHVQPAIVFNQTPIAELVHEEANVPIISASVSWLTLAMTGLRFSFFAEIRQ